MQIDWLTGVVFPYINLFIFLVILLKGLKGPLSAAINRRHDEFKQVVEEANQAKAEAEARNKELQTKLANLDRELTEIRENAQRQAQEEAERIVHHAETLANHLKGEAERIARSEIDQARQKLRQEILEQVRGNIVRKLETELDRTNQTDLIRRQLNHLPTHLHS